MKTMTKEAFIKKWLGNRYYNYCEEHKDLMRDDLDSCLEFHKQQVNSVDLADVGGALTSDCCGRCDGHNDICIIE